MLKIQIPSTELWDSNKREFISIKGCELALEHSLVAISKWEAKWHKPFFDKGKTRDEILDYIKCMTISQNVNPLVYQNLPNSAVVEIMEYLKNPMTAAVVKELDKKSGSGTFLTSDLIYYYMIAFNIPFECQKWHINRLMTLIKICNAKNQPPKKMSRNEILRQNAALNAKRRAQYGSKG